MKFHHIALIAVLPLLGGCKYFRPLMPGSTSEPSSKLVREYSDQLDIHSSLEKQAAESGMATPVLHVTVTNTGNRNVNYLKLVVVLDIGNSPVSGDYHDVRVIKPLTGPDGDTTLLARDGGTTSFLVHFKNAPDTIGLQANVRLTEIGFTK